MARTVYGLQTLVGSILMAIAHSGPLVAFAAHTRKFTMGRKCMISAISLNVGARGGTHSTSTIDVQKNGVSILTAVFDVAALTPGTIVEKVGSALAAGAASVAPDDVISVVLAEAGGTAPTFQDADLQIDFVPIA